jgi:hypothetical protein
MDMSYHIPPTHGSIGSIDLLPRLVIEPVGLKGNLDLE